MTKPNFFIVGAPKCGTSAVNRYLKSHPDVFMSEDKEPHYFSTDLDYTPRAFRYSREQYLALFPAEKGAAVYGEATPYYLYSRAAAPNIHDFNPRARILIMLRNPADMLHSLHSHMLYTGDETLEDFDAALEAEAGRRQGVGVPEIVPFTAMVFYRHIARYTDQVRRYFETFDRDQVCVMIFDDLQADTPGEYVRLLRFLGVDETILPDFGVINPNKRRRSAFLRDLMHNVVPAIPEPVRRALRRVTTPEARRGFHQAVDQWNTSHVPRKAMRVETRQRLQEEFREEVERLSELLDRDLTHWSNPPCTSN